MVVARNHWAQLTAVASDCPGSDSGVGRYRSYKGSHSLARRSLRTQRLTSLTLVVGCKLACDSCKGHSLSLLAGDEALAFELGLETLA